MSATILLVEDDEIDILLFRRVVARSGKDVELRIACDGLEALEMLESAAPDLPALAVLDINMPRMSGLELLREIRSRPALAGLRACILTTSTIPAEIAESERLGVVAHLVKGTDALTSVLELVEAA